MYANGLDTFRVMPGNYESSVKSVSHGITYSADLDHNDEVWKVMLELPQDIGHRLRLHSLTARGVQATIRDNDLYFKQYQAALETQSQSPMESARKSRQLFEANYRWTSKVRAVIVRAINLIPPIRRIRQASSRIPPSVNGGSVWIRRSRKSAASSAKGPFIRLASWET